MTGTLSVFPTPALLVRETAGWIADTLSGESDVRGPMTFVLSGGSTPRSLYETLAGDEFRRRIDWGRLHILWGDERCVPPDNPESNFRMANESLLSKVPVPREHVHRIRTELPPAEAATLYAGELHALFGVSDGEVPRLSLVLLGLGADGHTASLFPGTTVLGETRKLAADVYVPSLGVSRVTMTLPLLNNARSVLFLVEGRAKAAILRSVLEGEPDRFPAQLLNPIDGALRWHVDGDAASQLTTVSHT